MAIIDEKIEIIKTHIYELRKSITNLADKLYPIMNQDFLCDYELTEENGKLYIELMNINQEILYSTEFINFLIEHSMVENTSKKFQNRMMVHEKLNRNDIKEM